MHKIAVHVNKGGVGKTTIVGHTSFEIAKRGYDVVVIDFDCSQGQLSYWITPQGQSIKREVGEYLLGDCDLTGDDGALMKIRDHLFLLPCRRKNSITKKWSKTEGRNATGEKKMLTMLKELEALGFEYCIFDLAPGMLETEELVLTYADEVINVLEAESFGIAGLDTWRESVEIVTIARELRRMPDLINNKLIVNSINKTYSTHTTVLDYFKKQGLNVMQLGTDRKIADCNFQNIFVQEIEKVKESTLESLNRIGESICQ